MSRRVGITWSVAACINGNDHARTVDGPVSGERSFALKMQDDGVSHHVLLRLIELARWSVSELLMFAPTARGSNLVVSGSQNLFYYGLGHYCVDGRHPMRSYRITSKVISYQISLSLGFFFVL